MDALTGPQGFTVGSLVGVGLGLGVAHEGHILQLLGIACVQKMELSHLATPMQVDRAL